MYPPWSMQEVRLIPTVRLSVLDMGEPPSAEGSPSQRPSSVSTSSISVCFDPVPYSKGDDTNTLELEM